MVSKTRMLLLAFVVSVAGIFLFGSTCSAEKIAYVDLTVIFDGYNKTKDYDMKLEDTRKSEQETIDKKVEEIKTLQDKLPLLSEKEKQAKQEEVDKLAQALQEYQRNAETTLIQDRNDRLQEVLKDIQQVVDEIAKQEKYDYILNERALLYGSEKLSISNSVLKKLNDKYKKG